LAFGLRQVGHLPVKLVVKLVKAENRLLLIQQTILSLNIKF
jgi:hypothetical protein